MGLFISKTGQRSVLNSTIFCDKELSDLSPADTSFSTLSKPAYRYRWPYIQANVCQPAELAVVSPNINHMHFMFTRGHLMQLS